MEGLIAHLPGGLLAEFDPMKLKHTKIVRSQWMLYFRKNRHQIDENCLYIQFKKLHNTKKSPVFR